MWFCPGLPPTLPHAVGRGSRSRTSATTPADVVVTDLADKGTRHPRHDSRFRAELGRHAAPRPARRAGRARRSRRSAVGCSSRKASRARARSRPRRARPRRRRTGTSRPASTPRGVQQWLVIDNPYASDAKVDVTLRTSSGVRRPDALQGLDVARRSRDVIADPRHRRTPGPRRGRGRRARSARSSPRRRSSTRPTPGRPGVAHDARVAGAGVRLDVHRRACAPDAIDRDRRDRERRRRRRPGRRAADGRSAKHARAGDRHRRAGRRRLGAARAMRRRRRRPASRSPTARATASTCGRSRTSSIVAQTLTRFDDARRPRRARSRRRARSFRRGRGRSRAAACRGEQSTTLSLFNPGAAPARRARRARARRPRRPSGRTPAGDGAARSRGDLHRRRRPETVEARRRADRRRRRGRLRGAHDRRDRRSASSSIGVVVG